MQQLTVKVKRLNKRTLVPMDFSDRSTIVGTVTEGYNFLGNEADVTEVPNQALGKWYKDRDGYFYWGGGVEEGIAPVVLADILPAEKINYQSHVGYLKKEWLTGNGKNTTVVLIDTGVNVTNSKFNAGLISETDLTDGASADKDHGTFICGLICGKGSFVTGVANDSKLVSIRYKDDITKLEKLLDNLVVALNKVIELKQNNPGLNLVVNMSQGLNKQQALVFPEKIVSVTQAIKTLSSLDALLFCAAGENRQLLEENLLFPALLPETIAVGCIEPEFANLPFSKKVDFISSLQEYRSYNKALEIVSDSGSSFSVAIMAAVSLLIKSMQLVSTKDEFKEALQPFSRDVQNFRFNNTEYDFFINK